MSGDPKSGEIHPDLTTRLLYQEPVVGIYHRSLDKQIKRKQELKDLIDHQFGYVEFLPTLTLGLEMKRYFYRLDVHPLTRIKTDSVRNSVLLINSSPLWGIGIPLLMRILQNQTKNIQSFILPEPTVYSTWHLIYRRYESEYPAKIIEKMFKDLVF